MSIPIEFFLNFNMNSSNIIKGFDVATKGMRNITQSVAEIVDGMKSGIFGTSSAATEMFSNLEDKLQGLVDGKFGGGTMGTSFGVMFAKNMAQELSNSTASITGALNTWVSNITKDVDGNVTKTEAFNFAENASSQLKNALANMAIDPKMSKSYLDLGKNMGMIDKYSQELSDKRFKPFMDVMDKIKDAKSAEELVKLNKELKNLQRNVAFTDTLKDIGKGLVEPFKKMGGMFNSYFAQIAYSIGLYSVFTDAANAHTQAAQNVARYGVGAMRQYGNSIESVRSGIEEFTNETMRVGKETQTSLTDAARAMGELAQLRLSRNVAELGEMAETTTLMSKAFNISTGEAAQFARSIIQVGGMGAAEFRSAGDALAGVQSELGLTEQGARATMNQVGLMMRQFKGFGASSSNVGKVTREVGRLASAFEKAGLSADDANAILTKMMDPAQINDNIMLWHGLGMSASDGMAMMTGDADQMTGMTERMRDMARSLKDQYGGNAIALQEMAAAYGMNYQQVQALANLSDDDIKTQQERADLDKAALAARQGMQDQLQRMWGSLNIILQEVVMPLMRWASKGLEKLATMMQAFSKWGDETKGAGKIIVNVLKAIVTLIGIGLVMNLTKVGSLLKNMLGGFGQLKNQVVGVAKGIKSFVSNLAEGKGPIESLKNAIGGGSKTPAADVSGGADSINKTNPDKVSKLGEAFKSFPSPAQILAVAVAIVALGVAIGAIILSIAVLANVMKEFEWQEMLIFFVGIAAVVAILMWGMVSAIGALGAIGAASAPGILAAAVAIIALGAGVAIILLSVAALVLALSMTDGILGKLLALTIGLTIFGLAMTFLAPIIAPAIPLLLGFAGALLVFGLAMVLVGAGVSLILGAFTGLINSLTNLSAEQIGAAAGMFVTMTVALFAFAGALALAGIAMLGFSVYILPFLVALAIMSAGIIMMTLLGRASTRLAENMTNLGQGLQLIAQNASIAMEGIKDMMSYFQDNQISALESFTQRFVKQMQHIAESIMQIQVSIMVGGLMGFVGGLLSSIPGVAEGASQSDKDSNMSAVVDQLIQSNEHLSAIQRHSEENTKSLKSIVRNTQQSRDLMFDFAR